MSLQNILQLAISYPDFKLNQIIDPEHFDLNNRQIVDKINAIIVRINSLTSSTTGAGNITIATLPEFPTATNVQTALQQIATFAKNNKNLIDQIVSKNTEQDGRLTTLETRVNTNDAKDTSQDTEITSIKTRLDANDTTDAQQNSKLNVLEAKVVKVETSDLPKVQADISKNTTDISSIKVKNTDQDVRISNIEGREQLDNTWINAIEGKVDINTSDVIQIKKDLADIGSVNPNVELVASRTNAVTGETYETLQKRLDKNEIGVGTEIPQIKRSKLNFLITDSNATATWENSVKLGDLNAHNTSSNVHPGLIGGHELNMNSHPDIRADLTRINDTLTNRINLVEAKVGADMGVISAELNARVDGVDGKIGDLSTLTTTQKSNLVGAINEQGGKIGFLESERGYLSSKIDNSNDLDLLTLNGKYDVTGSYLNLPSEFATSSEVLMLDVTSRGGNFVKQVLTSTRHKKGLTFIRTKDNTSSWSSWKKLSTTEQVDILKVDKPSYVNSSYVGKIGDVCGSVTFKTRKSDSSKFLLNDVINPLSLDLPPNCIVSGSAVGVNSDGWWFVPIGVMVSNNNVYLGVETHRTDIVQIAVSLTIVRG